MKSVVDVIAKLKQAEKLETYQGEVSDSEVELLSTVSGCILPSDYLYFLKACGFASWFGNSVFGIYDSNDTRFPSSFNFSAARQTSRARELNTQDHYPDYEKSIVIGVDGMGGYFLLLSHDDSEPIGVKWVNYDETWVITETWQTFTDFLEFQLAN